jgi:para-nitrobenzyl esterase
MVYPRPKFLPRVVLLLLALGSSWLWAADVATSQTPDGPVASTTHGRIRGYFDQQVNVFKGVPYGGDTAKRRFRAPLPPEPWSDIRECRTFGPPAPQLAPPRPGRPRDGERQESEDCLRLNVWTPALRDGAPRPVLVYFHGGAYSNGSVNSDVYDGVRLCKRGDVVVVTVNHRLNGFGYLFLGDIAGAEFAESGNAGMLDLILALEWVRDNIREFGGDAQNVTIFGQSGGGAKCATLMAMPRAAGLFHKVWTMSGQQVTGRKRENANSSARTVLSALGLTPERVAELQTVPQEKLVAAMRGINWTPVVDGALLPRDPFAPDASPLSAHIPMVLGNTHDETRNLIGEGDPSAFQLTWDALPAKIVQHVKPFIGDLAPEDIVREYRRWYPNYTPTDVFFAATTAARSWKSMVIECDRRAEQNGAPTWVYHVNWASPVDGGKWKAPHALDIPLVFDNVAYGSSQTGGGADAQAVADAMSEALLAFARSGNPNHRGMPPWPKYELKDRPTMVFDVPTRLENDPRGNERKLFAPALYIQPGT